MGLKIIKSDDGFIKISNPKVIHRILVARRLENCNITLLPYQIRADLTGTRDEEALADKHAYQSDVGVLRFVTDTTHPAIACWAATYKSRPQDTPTQSDRYYAI